MKLLPSAQFLPRTASLSIKRGEAFFFVAVSILTRQLLFFLLDSLVTFEYFLRPYNFFFFSLYIYISISRLDLHPVAVAIRIIRSYDTTEDNERNEILGSKNNAKNTEG